MVGHEATTKTSNINRRLENFKTSIKSRPNSWKSPKKREPPRRKRDLKSWREKLNPRERALRDLQLVEDGLYEETAESRARNKVILWWMLYLAYCETDGNEVPFFGDGTIKEKLEQYDEIEEGEDIFRIVVARKIAYYVSFWFVGRPNSQKEFQAMIDLALKLDEEEEADKMNETKDE